MTTTTPQTVTNTPMRDRRSPLASVGLHATLIVASVIAVFRSCGSS